MKKRKMLITIIIAAVLIFASIFLWKVFLAENKVPRKFPAQPPKKVEEMLQEQGAQFSWPYFDENGNLIDSSRYYGTYGDCIAVFESMMLCWVETKHIADSEFTHSSSFVIWIYRDGKCCTIKDAWEQGLLTKEQIELMAEYHRKAEEYVREYRQA